MKIAITAKGKSLDSLIDPRFGRAQCFIVMDTETGEHQVVSNNQNVEAAQGAGIQAGKTVVETGVEAVITGNVGPKAFRTLQAAEIEVYLCSSESVVVQEAFDRFLRGELEKVSEANVWGHWM